MRLLLIVALMIGAAAIFGIGFMAGMQVHGRSSHSQESMSRQELLKQLVIAKAAIATGQSLADFGAQEKQLRAAFELALETLNNRENSLVTEALEAIIQTRVAWQETFAECHRVPDPSLVFLMVEPPCNNKTFDAVFESMGILSEFKNLSSRVPLEFSFKRSRIMNPLFTILTSRLQSALETLRQ